MDQKMVLTRLISINGLASQLLYKIYSSKASYFCLVRYSYENKRLSRLNRLVSIKLPTPGVY